MSFRALAGSASLLLILAGLGGCGGNGAGPQPPGENLADTTGVVGSAVGGTVELSDGASITFPAGSLSDTATVSVAQITNPAPFPDFVVEAGHAYRFNIETSGVTFTTATIRYPLPTGSGDGAVFSYVEATDEWAIVAGTDTGDGFIERDITPTSRVRGIGIGGPGILPPPLPLPPAPPPPTPPPPIPNPTVVSISGGTFFMGSEGGFDSEQPVHAVHVDGFSIGKYEITNSEFCSFLTWEGNASEYGAPWITTSDPSCRISFVAGNPGSYQPETGYENYPVVCVTPAGAMAFCNWLSTRRGLQSCYGGPNDRGVVDIGKNGYRLPTEAEWEYVATLARGELRTYTWGTSAFSTGSPQENAGQVASGPRPVGSHGSLGWWGIYDLGGNVTEFVSDWLEYEYYESSPSSNPVGPDESPLALRAIRGANYATLGDYYMRVAVRNGATMNAYTETFGFRVAKSD